MVRVERVGVSAWKDFRILEGRLQSFRPTPELPRLVVQRHIDEEIIIRGGLFINSVTWAR